MSELKEKIKDIFRRVDIAANGQVSTSYWGDADINLSAPDGMDYWEWIEQASNNALNEADKLTARNAELEAAIGDVLVEYKGLDGCKVLIEQCEEALKDNS